jgi:histidyl-tRNA synthetase
VLLALAEPAEDFEPVVALFIAVLGEKAQAWALPVAHRLRMSGIRTEIEHRPASLKAQLKRADGLKARLALIVGDNELQSGKLVLRDLGSRQQHEVPEAELEAKIRQLVDF